MRSGENPLDLNNLPDEYGRDGKQIFEDSSNDPQEASDATRCRKKKSNGKDECGKVYECRFCSLKFCKSQALGGHMNRHRQERETETLNRARQLVFSNDTSLAAQGGPHGGMRDMNMSGVQPMMPMPLGNYPQNINMLDRSLPYRPAYPTRIFPSSSPTIPPPNQPLRPQQPPPQGYLYTPSSRLMSFPSSHYPPPQMNDYFLGHVLPPNSHRQTNVNHSRGVESGYTCIGEPLGREYQSEDGAVRAMDFSVSGGSGEDDRSYASGTTQCFDHSSMNRFNDGL